MTDKTAGVGPVEQGVRPDPERAAFERWCVQRWGGDRNALGRNGDDHPKHPGEYTMGNIEFSWQAWQAGRESARARFRDVLVQHRRDPFSKPPNLEPVIAWLENGCDPREAARELRTYQAVMHPKTPNVRAERPQTAAPQPE